MESLIAAMTRERPEDRLRIEDVIRRFAIIRETLSKTKLRSALTSKNSPSIIYLAKEAINMLVRFSTSFRGRLPFRIRDIFCQSTCLSHLYSKVTKVSKYSMRYGLSSIICFVLDTNGGGPGNFSPLFFNQSCVRVCFIWRFWICKRVPLASRG